jgi:hypothetical protein
MTDNTNNSEETNFTEQTITAISTAESLFSQFSTFYKVQKNKKYVNHIMGYGFFACIFFGIVDFSILTMLYFAGLAYLSAIEYYNNELQPSNDTSKSENINNYKSNLSLVSGWVSFCSLIVFDGIIKYFGGFFFGTIIRFVRVILYVLYSRNFIKFMEDRKSSLEEILNQIKSNKVNELNQQENRVTNIDNVFQSLFVDIVFINNKILGTFCLDYNIIALTYVITPMNYVILHTTDIVQKVQQNGFVEGIKIKTGYTNMINGNNNVNNDTNNENAKRTYWSNFTTTVVQNQGLSNLSTILSNGYNNVKSYLISNQNPGVKQEPLDIPVNNDKKLMKKLE